MTAPKPPIVPVPSRARARIEFSIQGKSAVVGLANGLQLLFYNRVLIGIYNHGTVFYRCTAGAEQRAVNAWSKTHAMIRCDASQFDFAVGQVLTMAGLPLTHSGD